MQEEFGELVRQAREELGWSQEELGHRVGVTGAQISRIESGARGFSFATLKRLVAELDLDPNRVLRADESELSPTLS